MNNKYEVFIKLLNFLIPKYSSEKIFKDFIYLFAISLSNKVYYNQDNNEMYHKIYNSYQKEEQYIFYALSAELVRLFKNEKEPYDIFGDIYKKVNKNDYLTSMKEALNKKVQNIFQINRKENIGKLIDNHCGTGSSILAYACTLKLFKLDYKYDLEVTATDYNLLNVFMTYIQLYFYQISAVVILIEKETNQELMRLYTPEFEDDFECLVAA